MATAKSAGIAIRRLDRVGEAEIGQLAAVLVDCVEGGASVSFMLPLDAERAAGFWRGVAADVARGDRILFVAEDERGILGTVQLVTKQPENQPHRADVAKMLVHRRGRKRGVGAALMRAVEAAALAAGKTLLVLDTVPDTDADRLYRRLGWEYAGTIPDYALWPGGGFASTSIFYRKLA